MRCTGGVRADCGHLAIGDATRAREGGIQPLHGLYRAAGHRMGWVRVVVTRIWTDGTSERWYGVAAGWTGVADPS